MTRDPDMHTCCDFLKLPAAAFLPRITKKLHRNNIVKTFKVSLHNALSAQESSNFIELKALKLSRIAAEVKRGMAIFWSMAGAQSVFFLSLAAMTPPCIWRILFPLGLWVNTRMLKNIHEQSNRGYPIIYLPTHKSHLDYMFLHYVFLRSGMKVPHVIAGENLNIPIVGPLLRRQGALFIKRSFANDKTYTLVFNLYLIEMLRRRASLQCFIEGGRSRCGKLLAPRLGFLSVVISAILMKAVEDIYVVPVNISYDRVLETKSYINELLGCSKEAEHTWGFIKSVFSIFMRASSKLLYFGKVDMRFSHPISVRSFLQEKYGADLPLEFPVPLHRRICTSLGYRVLHAANACGSVLPGMLVGTLLLIHEKRGMRLEDLYLNVAWLASQVAERNGILCWADLTIDQAVKITVNRVLGGKTNDSIIKRHNNHILTQVFHPAQRLELSLLRNGLMHVFISEAIIMTSAASLLNLAEDESAGFSNIPLALNRSLYFEREFSQQNAGPGINSLILNSTCNSTYIEDVNTTLTSNDSTNNMNTIPLDYNTLNSQSFNEGEKFLIPFDEKTNSSPEISSKFKEELKFHNRASTEMVDQTIKKIEYYSSTSELFKSQKANHSKLEDLLNSNSESDTQHTPESPKEPVGFVANILPHLKTSNSICHWNEPLHVKAIKEKLNEDLSRFKSRVKNTHVDCSRLSPCNSGVTISVSDLFESAFFLSSLLRFEFVFSPTDVGASTVMSDNFLITVGQLINKGVLHDPNNLIPEYQISSKTDLGVDQNKESILSELVSFDSPTIINSIGSKINSNHVDFAHTTKSKEKALLLPNTYSASESTPLLSSNSTKQYLNDKSLLNASEPEFLKLYQKGNWLQSKMDKNDQTLFLCKNQFYSRNANGERNLFPFLTALLYPTVESYFIAIITCYTLYDIIPNTSEKSSIIKDTYIKIAQSLAEFMYFDGLSEFYECLNKDTYSNAVKVLEDLGILSTVYNDKKVHISFTEVYSQSETKLKALISRVQSFRRPPRNTFLDHTILVCREFLYSEVKKLNSEISSPLTKTSQ